MVEMRTNAITIFSSNKKNLNGKKCCLVGRATHTGYKLRSQLEMRNCQTYSPTTDGLLGYHEANRAYIAALWATGGLAAVPGKLPLSLPSPRASNPALYQDIQ